MNCDPGITSGPIVEICRSLKPIMIDIIKSYREIGFGCELPKYPRWRLQLPYRNLIYVHVMNDPFAHIRVIGFWFDSCEDVFCQLPKDLIIPLAAEGRLSIGAMVKKAVASATNSSTT